MKKILLCFIMIISLLSTTVSSVFAVDYVYGEPFLELQYEQLYGLEKTEDITNSMTKNITKPFSSIKKVEISEEEIISKMDIYQLIEYKCNVYEIPYDIVIAISILETGWFTSNAYLYGNNPGGLSRNEIPMSFDTLESGVERFVSNLANNYFYIGLDTPEKIGQKYCPKNPNWANLVIDVMNYI